MFHWEETMTAAQVTQMSVDTLRTMLAQHQPVLVLDIRPAEERAEWAIPGSLHVDAYADLKAGQPGPLATLELPADRPVVTVCGAGKTSVLAADYLRARGRQALSLAGGMKAWSLAWNQAVMTLPDGETTVVQVRRTGKGCLSYLVGSEGEAAVVDPSVDPTVYLQLAQEHGWTITHVLDTHIHADHLSRARQLAEQSGATLYLPAQRRIRFPFRPLADGEVVTIGGASLMALHTPGHTLESTSYRLAGQALFTGDTLFLAGVGRPDLEATPDEARQRARLLYRSLQRILALPSQTLILPGHTSEPIEFDQKVLGRSLGEIQAQVELLRLPEEIFVARLLSRIPPTPPNHHQIVALNEDGQFPEHDPTELEAGANRCAIG
jgi:glyoxylase-like metal-dependent hydrolase (beta-lactamase superfamily II)